MKRIGISLALALTLALLLLSGHLGVPSAASAAVSPAASDPCVWRTATGTSGTYSGGYHVSVALQVFSTRVSDEFCGLMRTSVSITIDPNRASGTLTPVLIDGLGNSHNGSALSWGQSSSSQSRSGVSPSVTTSCGKGRGHLVVAGIATDFDTAGGFFCP